MQKRLHWLAFLAIALSGAALYFPFVNNELVFDDTSFFYGGARISYHAITPFDLAPRTLPYFTFAFIQTVTQSFEIQRTANLILHCINGYLLFLLCQKLQSATTPTRQQSQTIDRHQEILISSGVALAFVLHPVAVYGAGYLVQRTILFATFFSLLALIKLWQAFESDSWPALLWATAFSILSMFSKEHAVTLPLAATCLLWACHLKTSSKQRLKVATFLLLSAPAIGWLIYSLRYAVATPYEIHAQIYLKNGGSDALWPRSALAECGFYFQYLRLWLLPDTALMSIDLRMPFPKAWTSAQALLSGSAFLFLFIGGCYLLLRSRRFRLIGFGLLYTQILFLVEFSAVRIQEPFVLYRSYLWAPGFMLIVLNLLQHIPYRAIFLIIAITLPTLAYQAVDRLHSISTNQRIWEDAQAKLGSDELLGAFRIYLNRGVQYLKVSQYQLALTDFVTCNRLNPSYAGCLTGKAVTLSQTKDYKQALAAIEDALKLDPNNPGNWETKGKALEALGQHESAATAFAEAEARGGSIGTMLRKGKLGNQPLQKTFDNFQSK